VSSESQWLGAVWNVTFDMLMYFQLFSIIFMYFLYFYNVLSAFFFVFVIVSVWKMFYLSSHSAKVGNPNQTLPEQSAGLMMNRFAQ